MRCIIIILHTPSAVPSEVVSVTTYCFPGKMVPSRRVTNNTALPLSFTVRDGFSNPITTAGREGGREGERERERERGRGRGRGKGGREGGREVRDRATY